MRYFALLLVVAVSACGFTVPRLNVFPVTQGDSVNMVRAITQSIECELRRATNDIIGTDIKLAATNGARSAPWLDDWGVEVALTLKIVEGSSLNPSARGTLPSTTDPTPDVNIGASVPLSASATRTSTFNYYYLLADLYKLGRCHEQTIADLPGGSLLIRNDLRIGDWLAAHTVAAGTGAIPVSGSPKALTHRVDFVTSFGGSVDLTAPNTSPTVSAITLRAGADRKQTHSVLMTFGQANPQKTGLTGSAADAFRAAQIAASINQVQ